MIILRSKFYSSEEEKDVKKNNKDLAKALGIAGGSAALGAANGYVFNKMGKKLLDKKGEGLSAEKQRLLDEYFSAAKDWQWANDKANAGIRSNELGEKIVNINNMLANKEAGVYDEYYKNLLENKYKPKYRELKKISRSKEELEKAVKEEASLWKKYNIKKNLSDKAIEKENKFLNDLPNKLKRNKKLAWGVGLGTAASLGAHEYYKNKKKNKNDNTEE